MDRVSEAKAQATTPLLPEMDWQCAFCTYINNSMLPFCEMCENPRGSAGEYLVGQRELEGVCAEGDRDGSWQWCL